MAKRDGLAPGGHLEILGRCLRGLGRANAIRPLTDGADRSTLGSRIRLDWDSHRIPVPVHLALDLKQVHPPDRVAPNIAVQAE